jgi:hypothetical protein
MSLLHLLKATQDNASEWLQQLPVWFQDLSSVKDSLFQDEEALQAHQEQVNRNQAEIDKILRVMQITPRRNIMNSSKLKRM